jgi:hypothetical protein
LAIAAELELVGRSAAAPELLQLLRGDHRRRCQTDRADLEQRIARRRLRTLCEDLDQVLGQVGDAVRRHHVKLAARLLDGAVAIAAELERGLPATEGGQAVAAPHLVADILDEVEVQRSLGLVQELDAELERIARGGGDDDAPGLAGRLGAEIDALAAAAASGHMHTRIRSPRLIQVAVSRGLWASPRRLPLVLEKS